MTQYNRRTFLKAGGAAGAIGLTGLSGCLGGITGGGGTPTIRMAYVVPVENLGSLMSIPDIQSELPNLGDAYEFEISRVQATTDGVSSMAAGDLDMTYMTTVSYGNAIAQEAVPGGSTAIATDFWDAHPDHYGFMTYSAADSDITEVADLEGKQLGITAVGTGIHAVYVKALVEEGISRDAVEYVELGFPSFTQAIKDGRFDAGIYPAFFAGQPRAEGFTEVFPSQDYFEPYPFAYVVGANNALDEKGDAMRAWGEDFAALFEMANNDRQTVVDAATSHFELPDGMLDSWYLTEKDYFRGSIQMDIEALNRIMSQMVDLEFLEEDRDYADYATNEYLP